MRVTLLSVGTRMPRWVEEGVAEYQKRIARDLGFRLIEVPLARRGKSRSTGQIVREEGQALLEKVQADDFVVALEVGGSPVDTPGLARRLQGLRDEGRHLVLLVGGPDGLDEACLERAQERWSLSPLTLPHGLVRVLLSEQLYRAHSILQGHPYHRE